MADAISEHLLAAGMLSDYKQAMPMNVKLLIRQKKRKYLKRVTPGLGEG